MSDAKRRDRRILASFFVILLAIAAVFAVVALNGGQMHLAWVGFAAVVAAFGGARFLEVLWGLA